MTVIGIAADFDPPHLGHAYLLDRARDFGDEVVVFLNADYTAHHTPPLLPYRLRREVVLELGADEVIPVRGYHQRFPLAYTVPVRVRLMAEEGVDIILDAGPSRDLDRLREHVERVLEVGDLFSIPPNVPDRNVVRWLAAVEYVNRELGTDVELLLVPELEEYSGRKIRAALRRSGYSPDSLGKVRRYLPRETFKKLERYLRERTPPIAQRKELLDVLNRAPSYELCSIAHLNTIAVREILRGRPFRSERQIWGALRRADYGSVLTRLALANTECRVTSGEIARIALSWCVERLVPENQSPDSMYRRDWFVAALSSRGIKARDADQLYRRANSYGEARRLARRRYGVDPGVPRFETFIGEARVSDGEYSPAISSNGRLGVVEGGFQELRATAFGATLLRYVLDDPFVDAVIRVEDEEARLIVFPGDLS
ncbi:adenylyltransferase/cytidyltransferase family protein [Methanopyrus sp. SNP6]|uniref:adenylyltransferase/cytidyltransferase family protein n=1 Tax=Methanopyrus sp. SNP6 TaxID=1937005 RepID=UPI001438FDF0|nr:adenylyltransferase/cytidyltransferase family protein [Methanopyrus sp. SNP6]